MKEFRSRQQSQSFHFESAAFAKFRHSGGNQEEESYQKPLPKLIPTPFVTMATAGLHIRLGDFDYLGESYKFVIVCEH